MKNIKLSLIENSHIFLKEAINKAIHAKNDTTQWSFAILNLIQSLELSLKEALKREHPILIFENIDIPKHTVSISKAFSRIQHDMILGMKLSAKEERKIKNTIEMRNSIIHSEYELKIEQAIAKFAETFSFLCFFQSKYLKVELEEILDTGLLESVFEIEKCFTELQLRASHRIKEENISIDLILYCLTCGRQTFVIEDGIDTCYLCGYKEKVVECQHCNEYVFEGETESIINLFDTDYSDCQTIIHNSFGYSEMCVCLNCYEKIKDDIELKRVEDYHNDMEEMWYRKRS